MGGVLVIGCVSFDTIHLELDGSRKTHKTAGGAGLYTALAAVASGAAVVLFSPRPQPLPDPLDFVDRSVVWRGPAVSCDEMPELEIVHHGLDRATLLSAKWRAERELFEEGLADLADQSWDVAHIAALSSASRQLAFLIHLRKLHPERLISAGTYARAIESDSKAVAQIMESADLFFMNENEAKLLCSENPIGPVGHQVVFVTRGSNGATVRSAKEKVQIPAVEASVLDPTGAGDTFCGATLAGLASGLSALESAELAATMAARVIEHPGPSYLIGQCRK